MASPKQRAQYDRFTFKGSLLRTQGLCDFIIKYNSHISMKEKCHMAAILHELKLMIRDVDMESKKQIGAVK